MYHIIVKKKIIAWTIFILINVGVLVFTMLNDFLGNDYAVSSNMAQFLSQYWWYLIIALVAAFGYILFRSLSSLVIMHFYTGKVRFKLCLTTIIVGQFYDKVTPFGSGGQPFQIHHLQKQGLECGTSVSLPVTEYVVGRFAFVFISIVAIILNATGLFGHSLPLNIGIYVMAIIGVVLNLAIPVLLIVALISKRACRKLTRFSVIIAKKLRLTKDPAKLYKSIMTTLNANTNCLKRIAKKKRLILCFIFAMFAYLSTASVGYFVIKAFGYVGYGDMYGWGWVEIVVLNLLIINAISFIPTPGGAGAAELSFYFVFASALLLSTGVASGAVATLIWRVLSYYVLVLFGFIVILYCSRRRKRQCTKNTK